MLANRGPLGALKVDPEEEVRLKGGSLLKGVRSPNIIFKNEKVYVLNKIVREIEK